MTSDDPFGERAVRGFDAGAAAREQRRLDPGISQDDALTRAWLAEGQRITAGHRITQHHQPEGVTDQMNPDTEPEPAPVRQRALAAVLHRTADLLTHPTRRRRPDEYDNTGSAVFRCCFEAARQVFGGAAVHATEEMITREYGASALPTGQLRSFRGDRADLARRLRRHATALDTTPSTERAVIEAGVLREMLLYRQSLQDILTSATGTTHGDPDISVHRLTQRIRSEFAAKNREIRKLREERDMLRSHVRRLPEPRTG